MLELRDVKFSVNDENGSVKNIINGISMNIDESKFVAITGPNGSGKSTLAKLIVGINQQQKEGFYIMAQILQICLLRKEQNWELVLRSSNL